MRCVGMVANEMKKESHWWWFEGHKNKKRSVWLQSTIEELDAKTKSMLQLIEEDADSFAKRAEMLYKKKPELISMVEDFYRCHRSLAERYDLIKGEPVVPRVPIPSPRAYCKSKPEKEVMTSNADLPYDTYSISSISEDYADSEIDEAVPEPELNATQKEKELHSTVMQNGEIENLKTEIQKLKEENKSLKTELQEKDGDKLEVIRQLSIAINILKEDNVYLRHMLISS